MSVLCVVKKNWDIEEHLRWSLKSLTVICQCLIYMYMYMSPDAAKWQFMFTAFPSEADMMVHAISPAPH